MKKTVLLLSVLFFLFSCSEQYLEKGSKEYIAQVKKWRQKRNENLKKKSIWTRLAGLYWLQEGDNTFGSAKDNLIQFPEFAPGKIGVIKLNNGKLFVTINNDVEVKVGNKKITAQEIYADNVADFTLMKTGRYSWYIIKRGTKFGIRLIDNENPIAKNFTKVPAFPINEDWVIEATWNKFKTPKEIEIPTVIGIAEKDTAYGEIVFALGGKEYHFIASGKGPEFSIIFSDGTNGEETYGAGRFVTAKMDTTSGVVIIDFNKAYNPPCAFTKYATCPLPLPENMIETRITAGEKFEGHH